jgi:hypothetical protein
MTPLLPAKTRPTTIAATPITRTLIVAKLCAVITAIEVEWPND